MRTKMIRKALSALVILNVTLALSACSAPGPSDADKAGAGKIPGSDAEKVEILLPMGEAGAGKQAFVNLGCTSCHLVSGVEGLPQPVDLEAAVDLADSVRGLSRSAILTSIISPAHVDARASRLWAEWSEGQRVWLGPGQRALEEEREAPERTFSPMANYRSVMTVEQLSDLAAFMHSVASQK